MGTRLDNSLPAAGMSASVNAPDTMKNSANRMRPIVTNIGIRLPLPKPGTNAGRPIALVPQQRYVTADEGQKGASRNARRALPNASQRAISTGRNSGATPGDIHRS